MPDFGFVPTAKFSPTYCVACMTSKDPDGFVDMLVELPFQGVPKFMKNPDDPLSGGGGFRVYLCAHCVWTAGRQVGMLEPKESDDLIRRLQEALENEAKAKDALEQEKDNKYVSLLDVQKLMKNQPKAALTPA